MKFVNYKELQIGLILLLVLLFAVYVTLDILHYELSDFAMATMASIWSMILLLIDVQGIAKIIQKENGLLPEPTNTTEGVQ